MELLAIWGEYTPLAETALATVLWLFKLSMSEAEDDGDSARKSKWIFYNENFNQDKLKCIDVTLNKMKASIGSYIRIQKGRRASTSLSKRCIENLMQDLPNLCKVEMLESLENLFYFITMLSC